jgi:hypothetical protein
MSTCTGGMRVLVRIVGITALLCAACGNASSGSSWGGEPSDTLGTVGDQAEFERFAQAARLSPAQRAAILKFLVRYERHFLAFGEARRAELVPPLDRHVRTLVLSELTPEQAAMFDRWNLPSSPSFHATSGK